MKLPGNEKEENQRIKEFIDECREQDKFLRLEVNGAISKRQKAYVTKMYDVDIDDEETDEVFIMVTEEGLKRESFMNADILHDFMLKQYEAEILQAEDLPENKDSYDTNWREKMLDWQGKENPMESVYVFVKHIEDGRYKDEWKLYRGNSEEDIRDEEDKPMPGENPEGYVYYCLGTVKQVLNNPEQKSDVYDFDRKKNAGRSVPKDLMALLEDKELHDAVEQIMD